MECEVCHQKQATVHLTQIIKGETHQVNLCEVCSKEKGVTDPTGFALAEMLFGMGGAPSDLPRGEKTCPCCGMPHGVFRKTGRLGCSECYTTFADGLDQLLRAMHRGIRHVGKVPKNFTPSAPRPPESSATKPKKTASVAVPELEKPAPQKKPTLEELQSAMAEAVTQERYEEAAELKARIQALEKPKRQRAARSESDSSEG
jgi:protein arginine kinase activator